MTRPMFQGSIVALVTPFRNGKVDEAKLRELVEIQRRRARTASSRAEPPASRRP